VVRRFSRAWLVLPAVAVVLVGGTVYLPFYSLGPGPARAVQPLIRFDERTRYESDGTFVLTSVRFNQLTPFGVVDAWIDPHESVVSRDELFAPGETEQEERERTISEMDQSKLDAAYVVLETLTGYPEEHGDGVLIQGVVGGCAADGELYPGDLVKAIDGSAVDTVREARRIIRAAPAGGRLVFDVTVEGEREMVSLVREPCGGEERPLVGISMIESFPFDVRISSGEIGGPSAGLAWALGLYDLLTAGDLTGGRTIATTGALAPDGTVFPIGGIEDKVVGAAEAGASVLILPEGNLSHARAAGREDVELVPVSTFADALEFLQSNA
jgi:PDZ domain-containing protein